MNAASTEENEFSLLEFNWDDLIAKPTITNVNGQELKVESEHIRVWLISNTEVHVEIHIDGEPGWSQPIIVHRAGE